MPPVVKEAPGLARSAAAEVRQAGLVGTATGLASRRSPAPSPGRGTSTPGTSPWRSARRRRRGGAEPPPARAVGDPRRAPRRREPLGEVQHGGGRRRQARQRRRHLPPARPHRAPLQGVRLPARRRRRLAGAGDAAHPVAVNPPHTYSSPCGWPKYYLELSFE